MDNRKFDPTSDLPKCDICGATAVNFSTKVRTGLEYVISFACSARWTSTHKLDFNRSAATSPDGNLTVWKESHPTPFLEEVPCSNAARIARKLRDDAKVNADADNLGNEQDETSPW